jgi:hypothetical protein
MSNGSKGLVNTDAVYLRNTTNRFAAEVRETLREWIRHDLHIFYAVNAFNQKRAQKENVVPGRLAHVDADGVLLPPPGPLPTRNIQTSQRNYQFLYEIDDCPDAAELESINRHLTALVKGDRGGHQLAKLFRMPGTINWKPEYNPNPVVCVVPCE